jgi:hypothetical protein
VRGREEQGEDKPAHRGRKTGASFSFTPAKQNQESRQCRIGSDWESCLSGKILGYSMGRPLSGPGEFWQQPPAQASSDITEVKCAGGGRTEEASVPPGCRVLWILQLALLGSKPVSVDFLQLGNKCNEAVFLRPGFWKEDLSFDPQGQVGWGGEGMWRGSCIAGGFAN